jgi:hypothetical protein
MNAIRYIRITVFPLGLVNGWYQAEAEISVGNEVHAYKFTCSHDDFHSNFDRLFDTAKRNLFDAATRK